MRTLIEKSKFSSHKRKVLHTCFVDFRKAFDSVPRDKLWSALQRLGIRGSILDSIRSMYSSDSACVLTKTGLTPEIQCTIGVKQGCPLSPTLFGLFVDAIEKVLLGIECDAPSLQSVLVPLLLFADDLVLMSTSLNGLQLQMEALQSFCEENGMCLNMEKTKTIFFNNKQDIPCSSVTYSGQLVVHATEYKYLGIQFHISGTFKLAAEQLRSAALKAQHAMKRRCMLLSIRDPRLQCQLFDTLVAPVLTYGSEVWGQDMVDDWRRTPQEKFQLGFLKRILGVCLSTRGEVVLGEFGRYPMQHRLLLQTLKYLNRILAMDPSRLLHLAFKEQLELVRRGKKCWGSKLQQMLNYPCLTNGGFPKDLAALVNYVNIRSPLVSINITHIKNMLRSSFIETMRSDTSIKLATYRQFKDIDTYCFEPYLSLIGKRQHARVLSQFRTGSHWLGIQTGRYKGVTREERLCVRCDLGVVDDEFHCLTQCPCFNHLRQKYNIVSQGATDITSYLSQIDQRSLAAFLYECRNLSISS